MHVPNEGPGLPAQKRGEFQSRVIPVLPVIQPTKSVANNINTHGAQLCAPLPMLQQAPRQICRVGPSVCSGRWHSFSPTVHQIHQPRRHSRTILQHRHHSYLHHRQRLVSCSSMGGQQPPPTYHTQGYVAMGSFHSENVDDLMAQSDFVYEPPTVPFDVEGAPGYVDEDNNGHAFLLDRDRWTFLNHGAFGAGLSVGYRRAAQWRYHLERQPLRYFDRELLPHLVYSARRLAAFCQVPSSRRNGFTLLPNATYGLNSVLKGYVNGCRRVQQEPHIILWDTSYGSLKKMSMEYCRIVDGRVTEIPVSDYFARWETFPLSSSTTVSASVFEDALQRSLDKLEDANTENALLILDHTTSNTALNMPLQSLSRIGKERGTLVMVDGAHGLLAQDLSLDSDEMKHVDFYIGNCHKWLSSPRGAGFLFCPDAKLRDSILWQPAVMSHGIGQGFQSRFLWDGCRDYGAALSLPAVLNFWEDATAIETRRKIKRIRDAAVQALGEAWHGTSSGVTLAPLDVHSPMMALVRLPDSLQSNGGGISTAVDAKRIQDFLYDQFIEVPIKCIRGVLYVRISCHIYNDLSEYERLATIMLQYPTS